jgi:predicted RNase H-like HicB family nuclease
MRYPVVIHKDIDSDFGVTVPDLPGCFSAGETVDEALIEVVEAIEGHIEGLLLDGEPIPPPKSIEYHRNNPDFADGIWAVVAVDLSKLSGKSRRVNITVPERILSMMDKYAAEHGETRSGLITQATIEFIASHDINGS